MTSTDGWFYALKRLQRQAFARSHRAERIPIHTQPTALCLASLGGRSLRQPELRVTKLARRVEFTLNVAGAVRESTRIHWNEESRMLTIHAAGAPQEHTAPAHPAGARDWHWYAEIPVGSDVEGNRAEAFLKSGVLRITAPRVDSQPLTGLPLLVWCNLAAGSALAPST